MEPIYVGIDPGQGGGIAVICGSVVAANKMPETERDLLDCLRGFFNLSDGDIVAVLERVHSSPQMGVSSSFKFGVGVGRLRMALVAAQIPFDEVTPQRWQKTLGCRSAGDKNVTKSRAQSLFPDLKVTHAIADALLIAEYCRRVRVGEPTPDEQTLKPRKRAKRFAAKRVKEAKLF